MISGFVVESLLCFFREAVFAKEEGRSSPLDDDDDV